MTHSIYKLLVQAPFQSTKVSNNCPDAFNKKLLARASLFERACSTSPLSIFSTQLSMNLFSRVLVSAVFLAFTAQSQAATDFAECPQFFANKKPPIVALHPMQRALCYDAFAILHSGESKTAVYVAQKLNRASVADADEKRKDKFFADARLRSSERANLGTLCITHSKMC